MQLFFILILLIKILSGADGQCRRTCDTALASYYVWQGSNLTFISEMTGAPIQTILSYNPQIPNQDTMQPETRVNIPFPCECIDGEFLGHVFDFRTFSGVTYNLIARTYFSNLTTAESLQRSNPDIPARSIPATGVSLNVRVNCSCGDSSVSKDYGLFVTYPLREGETLESVALASNVSADLLRRYNPAASFRSGSGVVFIPGRDQSGNFPPLNVSKGLTGGAIAGISVAAIVGVLLFAGCICVVLKRKKNAQKMQLLSTVSEAAWPFSTGTHAVKDSDLPFFSLSAILQATDNFSSSNKLGEGGFGPVYRGMMEDGQEIAVKRLSKTSSQGVDELKNEVILIAKLQHRNLVRTLGCCVEGEENMLIYEYMPNNSLDLILFDKTKSILLDWQMRFHIINGIAKGLLYLHQDSRLRIIHRDLKASNILLDADLNPKISDFGLARCFEGNETEAQTHRVVGTYGYMSPEYVIHGHFSIKSDVFSFGVLVLEIVSGKRNRGFSPSEYNLNLLGHAWTLYREGIPTELVDPCLGDSFDLSQLVRLIHVGLLCVQQSAEDRPNMSSVVFMLGSDVTLPQAKQPGFFTHSDVLSDKIYSENQVTITWTQGR